MDRKLSTAGGRRLGIAELGDPDGTPVLWCHGGPGSRLEPLWLDDPAARAGVRLIGVDRPGYGMSDPLPGRSTSDGVTDMIVVADALSIDRFATVGCSTGGTYALAAAAIEAERVLAVVACCSMTDMSWQPARATMSPPHAHAVWDAPDRDAAIAAAVAAHGESGSKMLHGGMATALGGLDNDTFADRADRAWMKAAMTGFLQMFTHGLQGYVDDRTADGDGWVDFDVTRIECTVCVLHGTADRIVDVVHAQHTADIVPSADLVMVEGHGHFSIEGLVITELERLL